MPKLPEKKAGIIACSGEELAEGTVTRLAALKVLDETRPSETVTLCLPLFLAGGQGERTFARFYPTITVDGCGLRCAAKATERYSAKPASSLVVTEIAEAKGITGIAGRRRLNEAGEKAVEAVAEILQAEVDRVLGPSRRGPRRADQKPAAGTPPVVCSCGSGLSVLPLQIAGRRVEVLALPAIFEEFFGSGGQDDETGLRDLLARVAVYNEIPAGEEAAWRDALSLEVEARTRKEKP
ncbi:MAG: putative zinc-binding protein [Candidatus Aminicenantes bacterium]|nr:putative zinc-binding protein [Candidatus Aminicenantes bacterium]